MENFLNAYQDSIAYMSDPANLEDAAQLVAQYGITPNAAIARSAIPQCNLTLLTGEEMQDQPLPGPLPDRGPRTAADPAAIGGSIPYDSLYYLP